MTTATAIIMRRFHNSDRWPTRDISLASSIIFLFHLEYKLPRSPVSQELVVLPPYTVLVQPLIWLRDAFDELHYQRRFCMGYSKSAFGSEWFHIIPFYQLNSLPPSQGIPCLGNHGQHRVLPKHLCNIDRLQLMYYQYRLDR